MLSETNDFELQTFVVYLKNPPKVQGVPQKSLFLR